MAKKGPRVALVPMPDPTVEERYSLGTAYVASALAWDSANRGIPADIRYLNDIDHALHTPEQITDSILEVRPDVVGLGLFVWNQHVARQVARHLRAAAPRLLVVGGGPWVSAEADRFARANPDFHVVVQGDGEAAFAELVHRHFKGATPAEMGGIPGTVVRDGDYLIETERVRVDPNAYPSPYLAGLVDARFSLRVGVRRGCGMKCRYCNWGGGLSKPLSVDRLTADLRWATDRGADEIWVVDSAINRRPADLRLIASALEQSGAGDRLRTCAFLDYRACGPEQIELLQRCNLDSGEVGLQTTNPSALRLAGRRFDRGKFEDAIGALRPIGRVVVDVLLGLPGDDPEGFRRTIEYLTAMDVSIHLFLLMALPGSDYSVNRDRYGLRFNEGGVPFLLESDTFPPDELADCAGYFVTRVPNKASGSDFTAINPRFTRYPYNYAVPMDVYGKAHKDYGEPLPPEPCEPGSEGSLDRRTSLLLMVEGAFGPELPAEGLWFDSFHMRLVRVYNDRAQLSVTDEGGGRAEVFLRPRTTDQAAYTKAGPFDIWYGKEPGMAEEKVCLAITALAARLDQD